jgi:hypothetical protein
MTKVNKMSKAVRDRTGWQSQIQWCKLWSPANIYKPQKRGWNIPSEDEQYPVKRDSKSTKQRSIIKIYCKKTYKNTKTVFTFSTY